VVNPPEIPETKKKPRSRKKNGEEPNSIKKIKLSPVPINKNFLILIRPVVIPIVSTETMNPIMVAGAIKPRTLFETKKVSCIGFNKGPLACPAAAPIPVKRNIDNNKRSLFFIFCP
jgi:hypothetical protein